MTRSTSTAKKIRERGPHRRRWEGRGIDESKDVERRPSVSALGAEGWTPLRSCSVSTNMTCGPSD
jgi:hypothetical protein